MFKITAEEKRAILKRRKARSSGPYYPGDPDSLLDPISIEDLIDAVIANEKVRNKAAIKKTFEALLKEVTINAREVLKHRLSDIEKDIKRRTED